ncbi:MAG: polyphosphate kinase 2 [Chthoniobacterales bacterium]
MGEFKKEKKRAKKEKKEAYEAELRRLQHELVKLQLWVKRENARVVVIFEGRDAAGKGGVIKRIMEKVSPRIFRTVALSAPSEREKTQMYFQRYIHHFPAAGEIVIFDRSWYNRAGVEHVMNYCSQEEYARFLDTCADIEKGIIDSGVQLVKYWFEVSEKEQTKRFMDRLNDPLKVWKLSPMDLQSHKRWYDYSRAKDAMFAATDTKVSPWYVVPADNKREARLNCISHLLSLIPYKHLSGERVKLPTRQKPKGYKAVKHSYRIVPRKYSF